jgi:hypothetical protein
LILEVLLRTYTDVSAVALAEAEIYRGTQRFTQNLFITWLFTEIYGVLNFPSFSKGGVALP